ncbi:Pisatin demethylase [Pseudocercospora fuligena]|uniref:Pisatin demethylase n=1 Tax=Pseudocercospora fuligena TaxID=685502 RepID=A0A8H6RAJ2_9PEZI|nr:Pisatin demethylase [Pseudocercospora fuligena]
MAMLSLFGALVLSMIVFTVRVYYFSPLCSISGPFLVRFTRLWYAIHAYHGHIEQDLAALHAKYGKIVRIAPHEYSIDDPEAVNIIYGRGSKFRKADFYAASERPGHPNLFSQRDVAQHDRDRRKYNYAYTMSAMVSYEKYVDDCVELLSCKLAEQKGPIDMAWWLHCFAFDVIGAITFSKRFRFLDAGEDVQGLIETVHGNALYATVFGIFHELYALIFHVKAWLSKVGILNASGQAFMQDFAGGLLRTRRQQLESIDKGELNPEVDDDRPKDFLAKYMGQHLKDPSHFSIGDVMNGLGANINAGSDTTSTTLSAILYHVHKNPEVLAKLRQELEENERNGNISSPITFKQAQSLPYLQAVIKETLRIHPAVGITLPRVVPQGGVHIAGHFFPDNEVVGINPYVAHRNKDVFGEDADLFRPEWWLEQSNKGEMEKYFMAFEMGSRSCIGRNVALLEITKAVPELLRRFEFQLLDEDKWNTRNWLFIMPEKLKMRVRTREVSRCWGAVCPKIAEFTLNGSNVG